MTKQIEARFVKDLKWTLTIKAHAGDGKGTTDPQPGVYPVKVGETIMIRAIPGPHSHLEKWLLDGEEIAPANPLILGG